MDNNFKAPPGSQNYIQIKKHMLEVADREGVGEQVLNDFFVHLDNGFPTQLSAEMALDNWSLKW